MGISGDDVAAGQAATTTRAYHRVWLADHEALDVRRRRGRPAERVGSEEAEAGVGSWTRRRQAQGRGREGRRVSPSRAERSASLDRTPAEDAQAGLSAARSWPAKCAPSMAERCGLECRRGEGWGRARGAGWAGDRSEGRQLSPSRASSRAAPDYDRRPRSSCCLEPRPGALPFLLLRPAGRQPALFSVKPLKEPCRCRRRSRRRWTSSSPSPPRNRPPPRSETSPS